MSNVTIDFAPLDARVHELEQRIAGLKDAIIQIENEKPKHERFCTCNECMGFVRRAQEKWNAVHEVEREIHTLYIQERGDLPIHTRGIGKDWIPCFVCGGSGKNGLNDNIAAFVNSREDGRAIMRAFRYGKLDWRPTEPNWIQIKLGGCHAHQKHLATLNELIGKYGTINSAMIADASNGDPWYEERRNIRLIIDPADAVHPTEGMSLEEVKSYIEIVDEHTQFYVDHLKKVAPYDFELEMTPEVKAHIEALRQHEMQRDQRHYDRYKDENCFYTNLITDHIKYHTPISSIGFGQGVHLNVRPLWFNEQLDADTGDRNRLLAIRDLWYRLKVLYRDLEIHEDGKCYSDAVYPIMDTMTIVKKHSGKDRMYAEVISSKTFSDGVTIYGSPLYYIAWGTSPTTLVLEDRWRDYCAEKLMPQTAIDYIATHVNDDEMLLQVKFLT